ncbi:MAG: hypothetical protein AAF645_00995 [Myxococcota bacterium]
MRFLLAVSFVLLAGGCQYRHTTIGPGATAELVLVNRSTVNICYVYFTPTSDSSYGSDRLGADEVLRPTWSRTWSIPPDRWDYTLQDCDGNTLIDRRRIDIGPSQRHTIEYAGDETATRTEALPAE